MPDPRNADEHPAEPAAGPAEPAKGDAAGGDRDGAEAPPADFDPADNPSNPDLVDDVRVDRGRD